MDWVQGQEWGYKYTSEMNWYAGRYRDIYPAVGRAISVCLCTIGLPGREDGGERLVPDEAVQWNAHQFHSVVHGMGRTVEIAVYSFRLSVTRVILRFQDEESAIFSQGPTWWPVSH